MSNLFSHIEGKSNEVFTTEILGQMLEDPLCLKILLDLLGSQSDPETMDVGTEMCSSPGGRPDITVRNDDELIFVENKPWDRSTLTNGTQIRCYADDLSNADQKIKRLCLLVRGKLEAERFQKEIVTAEEGLTNHGIEEIKKYYLEEKGVIFSILTWEHLLDALGAVGPETVPGYLAKQLKERIYPPAEKIEPTIQSFGEEESWPQLVEVVKKANVELQALCSESVEVTRAEDCGEYGVKYVDGRDESYRRRFYIFNWRSELWGHFQWGADLNHCNRWMKVNRLEEYNVGHPFFFAVKLHREHDFTQRLKHQCLYGNEQILLDHGFKQTPKEDGWDDYFFLRPLELEGDIEELKKNPELIAKAVKRVIDELTQAVTERLKEEWISTHSRTKQRIREWCEEQQRIGTIKFREQRDGRYTVFSFNRIGPDTAPGASGEGEQNHRFAIILYNSSCWIDWYPERKLIVRGPSYGSGTTPQEFSEQLDRMFVEFQKEVNSAPRV